MPQKASRLTKQQQQNGWLVNLQLHFSSRNTTQNSINCVWRLQIYNKVLGFHQLSYTFNIVLNILLLLFYNLFYVHLKNYFKVKVTTIVYYLNHEMYHTLTMHIRVGFFISYQYLALVLITIVVYIIHI